MKCEPIRERSDWFITDRKPTICPNCGKKEVRKAVLGYPTEEDFYNENILKNKNKRELVNIFFARSNIFHRKGQYEESAENLVNANNMKLRMYKSEVDL